MKYSPSKQVGLTLTEIIISLVILGIVTFFATHFFTDITKQKRAETFIQELSQFINLGRSTALRHNSTVTICKSKDGKTCSGNWSDGLILFIDREGNGQVSVDDEIIRKIPALDKGDILIWQAFPSAEHVQFLAKGGLKSSNGTFEYCPRAGANKYLHLIINKSGRARIDEVEDSICP